jgi:predicted lipoprotein with Yx(FWY)xxD motif
MLRSWQPGTGRRPSIAISLIALLSLVFTSVAWVTSAAAQWDTVAMNSSAIGTILTDGEGMTLYTWDRDDPTASTISTTASATWPLFLSDAPTAPAGLTGTLSAAPRTDGSMQVTYNGWPLYYYINDHAAGDTNGDGVGGIWHAVRVDG